MRWALIVVAFAGAAGSLGAQGGAPPARDTTRADSARAVPEVVRDSVKAPFTMADVPRSAAIGRAWRWSRDEIFQTGALSLAELLEDVPGVRVMRTGLVLAPQVLTWWGRPARVRLFVDGVAVDDLDARNAGGSDLGAIPTWPYEEIVAEPTPTELRVHMRTWRVERTVAETRVDALTDGGNNDLYRGFFGRRFQSGLGLQFAFQQFTEATPTIGGDGDGLSMFARLGWTRGIWSVDAVTSRAARTRNPTFATGGVDTVPPFTGRTELSYLRLARGTPGTGAPWVQFIASGTSFSEKSPKSVTTFGGAPADTADTTAFHAQYVLTGGVDRGDLRTTAILRYRAYNGRGNFSPALRGEWDHGALFGSVYAERAAEDSTMRIDAALRYRMGTRIALTGGVSRRSPTSGSSATASATASATTSATTFEGAIRVRDAWIAGGVTSQPAANIIAPNVFGAKLTAATTPSVMGKTFALWGPLYRAISFDIRGVLWPEAREYRPQNYVRARVGVDTDWRSRFPHGDFTLRASLLVEHMGGVLIPRAPESIILPAASPMSSMVEIRVKTATITWQFRNLLGAQYQTVPGFDMPARTNLYGVRWRFTN